MWAAAFGFKVRTSWPLRWPPHWFAWVLEVAICLTPLIGSGSPDPESENLPLSTPHLDLGSLERYADLS